MLQRARDAEMEKRKLTYTPTLETVDAQEAHTIKHKKPKISKRDRL